MQKWFVTKRGGFLNSNFSSLDIVLGCTYWISLPSPNTMVEEAHPRISLPTPPNTGVRLRAPPSTPSFRVQLPPAPLPVGRALGGNLATISPQKRDRANYPLGPFNIKRSKVGGSRETTGAAGRRDFEIVDEDGDEGQSYSEYLEFIQSGAIGFFRLHGDIYVVQGWDGKRKAAKV